MNLFFFPCIPSLYNETLHCDISHFFILLIFFILQPHLSLSLAISHALLFSDSHTHI